MKETIECSVVMLPKKYNVITTNDVYVGGNGILKLCTSTIGEIPNAKPQHLYFISSQEIKEGDWVICPDGKSVTNVMGMDNDIKKLWCIAVGCKLHIDGNDYKKIIAATNPSLGLPNIQQSFLEKYVAAQGSIDKVRLETICEYGDNCPSMGAYDKRHLCKVGLKLTEQNEVIVMNEPRLSEKQYQAILDEPSLGLHEEIFIEENFMSKDQELEDAAIKAIPPAISGVPGCTEDYNEGFRKVWKAGANWREEQSANEAIKFANWILGEASNEWNKRAKLPLEEAHKQLYELWKKNKS